MSPKIPSWLTQKIIPPWKKPRIRSAWQRRISKVLGVILLFLLGWFLVWRGALFWRVHKQFSALRAAGMPASGKELNSWYAGVPEMENAAIPLLEAFSLERNFSDSRSNKIAEASLLNPGQQWSPEIRKLVTEFVEMNSESLEKARQSVQRPKCRYPIDLSYGPDAELPHLAMLKALARTAALRAALAAQRDHKEWSEDIRLILKLSATLDTEPILISQLLRNSIIKIASETTEKALNSPGVDEISAAILQRSFAEIRTTNQLRMALIGERAINIPVFRMSWAEIQQRSKSEIDTAPNKRMPPLAGKPATLLWLSGWFENDLEFFLRAMDMNISLAGYPPPASLAMTNAVEQLRRESNRKVGLYSGILLPAFLKTAVRDATTQACTRLAQTSLAIERFRLRHGRLPQSLSDLTPDFLSVVPLDPFDGRSVRYHPLSAGYVVYSVDEDGKDDGGRKRPERKKSSDTNSYDITFTVER